MTDEALVIAAHGSHLDPDAHRPAFAHADRLRRASAFAEVRTTFWKEEPSFREVLRTLASPTAYVVPLFMSEGYFVDRVLPRELRLTGEEPLDVDVDVHLTPPVGTHPAMREVVRHRAAEVLDRRELGPDVGLAVVGHGTERHARSAASTHRHVERLRQTDAFGAVHAAFLDEAPRVEELTDQFTMTDVVVVPLFVADGYHTKSDIPQALGIRSTDSGFERPATRDGHRLWYAGAVGTDPRMATVIRDRAAEAGASIDAGRAHAG